MEICPFCRVPSFAVAYQKGEYSIAFCNTCGHGQPFPMPSEEALHIFYSSGHHAHAIDDSCNTKQRLRVLRTIQTISPGAQTLLDVGCGFGHYMDVAKTLGFIVSGQEIDAGRVSVCVAKGHQVWSGESLACIPPGLKWDVIVLNHVIEHLRNPAELLQQLHSRMHGKSILYVECPNFRSFRARIKGIHYEHVCPPEHIQYFSQGSLRQVLEKSGFRMVRTGYSTHELHVKDLIAYLVKGIWLRSKPYIPPGAHSGTSPNRFVDGKFPKSRRAAYRVLLAISRRFIPLVNRLGGDHLETYWALAS